MIVLLFLLDLQQLINYQNCYLCCLFLADQQIEYYDDCAILHNFIVTLLVVMNNTNTEFKILYHWLWLKYTLIWVKFSSFYTYSTCVYDFLGIFSQMQMSFKDLSASLTSAQVWHRCTVNWSVCEIHDEIIPFVTLL